MRFSNRFGYVSFWKFPSLLVFILAREDSYMSLVNKLKPEDTEGTGASAWKGSFLEGDTMMAPLNLV